MTDVGGATELIPPVSSDQTTEPQQPVIIDTDNPTLLPLDKITLDNNNENNNTTNTTNANNTTPGTKKRFVPTKRGTSNPSQTNTLLENVTNTARRSTVLSPTKTNSRRATLLSSDGNTTQRSMVSSTSTQQSIRELTPCDNVQNSLLSDITVLPELHRICLQNSYTDAQRLITSQPIELRIEYVNQVDSLGNTPLFYALSNDHIQSGITSLLLDYGANVNVQNNQKNTPLHIAFFHNYKKFVRMLIGEFNASVTIENAQEQLCHQTAPQPKGFNNDSVTAQFQHNGAMLHFITQCTDTYVDNINKKLILPHTTVQRAYYRSLYDLADINRCGYLTLATTIKLLNQLSDSDRDSKLDQQLTTEWYRGLDRDKNGIVYFNEFLYAVLTQLQEHEKAKRKAKRKAAVKAARQAKKAEQAARFARHK